MLYVVVICLPQLNKMSLRRVCSPYWPNFARLLASAPLLIDSSLENYLIVLFGFDDEG